MDNFHRRSVPIVTMYDIIGVNRPENLIIPNLILDNYIRNTRYVSYQSNPFH